LLKLIQINPGAQLDRIIEQLDLLAGQIDSKLTEQALAGPHAHPNNRQDITPPMPMLEPSAEELPPSTPPVVSTTTPQMEAEPAPPLQSKDSQTTPVEAGSNEAGPKTWTDFLKIIETKLPFIFALLSKGQVDESSLETVQVKLYKVSAFHKSRLKTKKEELHLLCNNLLGKKLEITIMSENGLPGKPDKQKANQKMVARNHPLVLDAQRIFDGEVIN
ncbi:MAG: hypothetical protein GY860_22475, partial [Desulfobacteraceae bacterium]|nr:hypothetical protein [Desulfobacteraceae bacterium]